jgi:hypothetical protein
VQVVDLFSQNVCGFYHLHLMCLQLRKPRLLSSLFPKFLDVLWYTLFTETESREQFAFGDQIQSPYLSAKLETTKHADSVTSALPTSNIDTEGQKSSSPVLQYSKKYVGYNY